MKRIFTHLFVAVLLMVGMPSWAQLSSLEVGQIYRFKSARADRSLRADGVDDVHTKTTDPNDKAQEWYVTKDGDYYVLRNVACGRFLKGAPSAYTAWSLTEDYSANENRFSLLTSNSTLNTLKTKGSDNYGHMHDDNNGDNGGYNVVGWLNNNDNTGSHWTITKVNYTAEQIKALLDAAPTIAEVEAYDDALAAIFADAACTALKDNYAKMSDENIKADPNYIALPAALQKTVLKIRNNAWGEDNADATKQANNLNWDAEYAKKFRMQMYEPYSIAGDITSWLGINSHANNDNPTGIYMPAAGTLYVMVEGEIKEGATLRIVDGYTNRRINGTTTESAVVLKQGLNVINYTGATGMLYICYNVDTYNPNGATPTEKFPRKLSEFAPLKIHIEGGAINGFYNACGDFRATTDAENLWKTYTGANVDADTDWKYMETRANLSILPILGHREILLLQLEDEQGSPGLRSLLPEAINCPSTPYSYAESWADYGMGCDPSTGKINIVMEAWDRIFYSQLATMGLVSNSQMERMNDLYPRWTKEGTCAEMYDYENKSNIDNKTYLEFCQGIDYSEYFNHHGIILGTSSGNPYGAGDHVGYPIGGFGAAVYDLPNTAGSTWGPAHEIGHQHQGLFTLNGLTEVTNNLFSNISLWYKGMSTSRYNGSDGSLESVLNAFNTNGSDIYTNNIWALTHLYYRLWLYYHLAGNNTQFYPRLFELLRQNQMQKGYNVSGDVSTLHFYKLACQAAGEDLTEFFRAHGYFSVMEDRFVGDYSNSIYNVSQAMIDAAIAEVKAMNYPENLSIIFINDDDENATYLQHDGKSAREIYFETKSNSDFGSVTDFIAGKVATTPYTATLNSDGTITMSGGTGGVGFLILNEKGEIISFSNKSTFEIGDEAKHALVSGTATVVSISSDNTVEPLEAVVDVVATRKEVLAGLIADVQAVIGQEDNTYTKVGYFKSPALAELKAALATAEEVYSNGTGYEGAYEVLYSEYRKVIDNPKAKVAIDTNLSYTIKNKAYTNRYITVSNETAYAYENATGTAAEWHFEQSSTAGKYYLKNSDGRYCSDVRTSIPLAVDESKEKAALYALQELDHGVWAIVGENSNFHAAASQDYSVVGWGTDAQASQWYITAQSPVGNAEALAGLEALISKAERLVDELSSGTTVTKGDACQLQTTASGSPYYLSSNAPSTEGSISYLVDGITGNNGNYFHSDWSSEPPSGSHYLLVDLGSGETLECFTISHTTRSGVSNDFPKGVDVYGSNDGNNYYYIGSADNMPQSANTSWEYNSAFTSVPYRYLRFNMHASRGYWHMAEFDLYPVTDITPTVKDIYSTGSAVINAGTLKTALNKILAAKAMANSNAPSANDITTATNELQTAYNSLLGEYNAILSNKLQSLKDVTDETDALIAQVGTVTLPLRTGAVALQANNPSGAFYISTNADQNTGGGSNDGGGIAALVDNNENTYFHTRWDGTKVDEPHYVQVDLGADVTAAEFAFSYKPRNGSPAPTAITVYGSNDAASFTEVLTTITSGLPAHDSGKEYNSQRIDRKGCRYLRFTVTASNGPGGTQYAGQYFFGMLEFDLELFSDFTLTVNNQYSETVSEELFESTYFTTEASSSMYETGTASIEAGAPLVTVELLDAQIADQQAAKTALEEAMAKMTVDKTALQSLYDNALVLYGEMADGEGHVNSYYEPSALTNEMLAAAKSAIEVADDKLKNSNSQGEIDAAKDALQAQYDALLEIKNSDVTGRDELNALIGDMQSLLGEVADKTTAKTAIALQTTDDESDFYIWSNATAWDCNGIGALIDKNDDGTAKTGTFFGTTWDGGAVEQYTHYLEIDMGVNNVLEDLSIDYTTRNSTHGDQRPDGLKFLGSNNKVDYEEFYSVTTGLPADANAKWTMPVPIELAKNYRYVRIAVSTDVGYFNMSDFNLYSNSIATVNEFYSTSEIFDCLPAVLRGYRDAKDAVAVYMTESEYDAAKVALQAQIDALQAIIDGNVDSRSELETLADETELLVTEVAAAVETETPVAMQCSDENAPYYLYCNADGTVTNGDGDRAGVAALVGDNATNSTHLHTTYNNQAQDDDLDHYLRLDMGENEAMVSFKFTYTGRINNVNNAPTKMLIEGSNDLENFDEIATLDIDVPESGTATYSTQEALGNGKAYRYIRFMVKDTKNHATNNGHPFFVLSQFAVTACKTIEVKTEYVSPNLPLSTLVTANNEAVEAKAMVAETEHYVAQTAYNTAVAELQAAKDALAAAIALKNIPVKLTTDVNNPVLYKIKINRNGDKRLQYDAASAMVAVADEYVGNKAQAWFFMSGADATKDVLILPYTGEGKVLATNSFSEGDSKVKVVESTADGYSNNWNIVAIADSEWSNITILNGSDATFYFSNHGGDSKKMGFYNTTPSTDGGSMFQFILDETDYSLSDAYYALYNQYVACGGKVTSGEVIGTYTVESATPYNDAYNNAAVLLEANNSTDEVYNDARTTLAEAYDALEYNGGLCKIRSAFTGGYSENKLVYVDAVNNPYFEQAADETLSKYVWEFVPVKGGYHLKSLHTQSYITAAGWGEQVVLGDEGAAKLVTVDFLDNENGIVRLNVAGGYPLHAQASGSKLVGYTGGLGTASAWYVEKVENVEEDIKHTVSLGADESTAKAYSTLYLAYNAQIPDGITASIVTEINEIGQLVLAEVTGGILPANTAVVLSGANAGVAEFKYTAEVPKFDTSNNILKGTSCNKLVECGDANNVYMLGKKNNRVAFYWTYENRNENGNKVTVEGLGTNHNQGGYVLCNANKAYLLEEESNGQAAAAMYSLPFGGNTTGVDEVSDEVKGENGNVKAIYDLSGRKLDAITAPGIYIVDGKKVYITEIED